VFDHPIEFYGFPLRTIQKIGFFGLNIRAKEGSLYIKGEWTILKIKKERRNIEKIFE
jgi:hypothetical protein